MFSWVKQLFAEPRPLKYCKDCQHFAKSQGGMSFARCKIVLNTVGEELYCDFARESTCGRKAKYFKQISNTDQVSNEPK